MPYHRNSVHSNGYSPDGSSGRDREESPTYLMEHLATFSVSKETDIVYPVDGMRRLLQLEKSNGIWSQKMQMRLDKNMVLVMDNETGDIMEKFPASLIQEPTAFTSNDPMEIYNNILVFIVGDDRNNSHSEMHIFQCQMISAQELVEDLKQLRIGKPLGHRGGHLPPPPPTPPPEPPLNGVNVREQVSVFNAASQPEVRGGSDIGLANHDDESSSTSSEKYGRDVTTLNHCFDDIEKFIARLQHSVAAQRELDRRKKSRKTKKKDMGDGLLQMRAKAPQELEFVDIFQKFKLSFILLAKLKHHIHDPNAPELVHFLFTPLALIVDASHDNKYAPNLPAKVVSPLLTQEAINLLMNCVTSKETELWHSLGEAWVTPREQWKGKVPPYRPVFMNGWSPDYMITDEDDRRIEPIGTSSSPISKNVRGEELRSVQHEPDIRDPHFVREGSHYSSDYFEHDRQASPSDLRYGYDRNYPAPRDDRIESQSPADSEGGPPPPPRSDISADSIERTGGALLPSGDKFERIQARWLEELRSTGVKIVQVTYPRTANNDKELSVVRGEYLQVLDDSRKWWKARNCRGEVAHVPHTIVTPYQPSDPGDVFANQGYSRGFYSPQDERGGRSSSIPAPPPAPLIQPAPATAEWVRKERLVSNESMDERQQLIDIEQLKNTLSAMHKRKPVAIKKTPAVYIDSSSSSGEVQNWLQAKGFDARVCNLLEGMNGLSLFKLKAEELETVCGATAGKRLHNQLTLQRNISKYQTTRGAELAQKLAKRREQVEETDERALQ